MSEALLKLLDNNVLQLGIWETIYMTVVSTLLAYLIGLPLGVILTITDKDGIRPIAWLNKTLGFIVNVFRSMPFIVLMVAFLPVSKVLVGKSYGNEAMIVMLVIAAAPYIARMVESSIKEVSAGIIEAAQSMGTPTFRIITKVLLPEAKISLIVGAVISSVTVLSYTAMGATISAGGLGAIAIVWGHQRSNPEITWICVFLIILIVQIIQEVGMRLAKKLDKRAR
jgi:D-methionine transport system permease protein